MCSGIVGKLERIPRGATACYSQTEARSLVFVLTKTVPRVEILAERDVVPVQLDLLITFRIKQKKVKRTRDPNKINQDSAVINKKE